MNVQPAHTVTARLLQHAKDKSADTALRWQSIDSHWLDLSWDAFLGQVRSLSLHLMASGMKPGDHVVLALPCSAHWEIAHHAVLGAAGVVVGLDAHESDGNLQHMLGLTQPRVLICADAAWAKRLRALLPPSHHLVLTLTLDSPQWQTFTMADGLAPEGVPWPRAQASDLATTIFTSGSTGLPKAVSYTQAQMCLAVDAITEALGSLPPGGNFACWMPLSNLFQRIANLWALMRGTEVWCIASPTAVLKASRKVDPVIFIGVPRFYDKLLQGIESQLATLPVAQRAAVGFGRCLCRWGVPQRAARYGLEWLWSSLDRRLLLPVRSALGAHTRYLVSGSAPLSSHVARALESLGWVVLQAYGMSECVVPIALNTPQAHRFGSVGQPLWGHQVRVAPDGELLIQGPGVSGGGGFRATGDFGHVDAEGFVWITGRKSDVFKTSTGRQVVPTRVESCLSALGYVDQVIALGRSRPFPVVLLTLMADAARDPQALRERIGRDVAQACQALPPWSQPVGVLVSRQPLTSAQGELTTNLKPRRMTIEARFERQLEALYADLARRDGVSRLGVPLVMEVVA